MSRRSSGTWLRLCLVIFAVVSALAVCGPALYWRFKKTLRFVDSKSSCPPCICDCPPPLSLLKIAPESAGPLCCWFPFVWLANLSVTDCGSNDPDLKKEMEKQFVDLLTEELKLQEAVAEEHTRHMNITFGEAKRVASQYQREAEKCIAAIETCEGARERAEALLIKERKVTTIWEQRARQMGWEGE
ncbi:Two-component response regulator-like PRR73 [Gossypium australe]|uniref:Two-component response regulator-like PRR73 n=1 Tax=Gossypium australe TaxID=47621 RepID=A0A5B6VGF3_9ROSI|nr:Two-component response regulator-like PRR73 [Gossypium australe]